MTDEKNFSDQLVKDNSITYGRIPKIPTGHRDVYVTASFMDYNYFKMIEIK